MKLARTTKSVSGSAWFEGSHLLGKQTDFSFLSHRSVQLATPHHDGGKDRERKKKKKKKLVLASAYKTGIAFLCIANSDLVHMTAESPRFSTKNRRKFSAPCRIQDGPHLLARDHHRCAFKIVQGGNLLPSKGGGNYTTATEVRLATRISQKWSSLHEALLQ